MAGPSDSQQVEGEAAAGAAAAAESVRLEEPDFSSANWYFSREDIEKYSPSRKDGIDLKKETYYRRSYCTYLQDLGMRLKVPQVTIATAIVFCHRFFLRQSHARNDRQLIATICMFLAGKVEETPRHLLDVIKVSYVIRFKKDPLAPEKIKLKQVLQDQKDLMLVGERLVLTTLGFDLNIHHPYKPLVSAIKKFNVNQNTLAQVAWNFVNDGLRTSLCLQFKPHHIAAGAIFLAAKFLKVKLPADGERQWWQEFEVTPRQLEVVSNQMLELYEQNKPVPGSKSSDPSASAPPRDGARGGGVGGGGGATHPSSNGELSAQEKPEDAATLETEEKPEEKPAAEAKPEVMVKSEAVVEITAEVKVEVKAEVKVEAEAEAAPPPPPETTADDDVEMSIDDNTVEPAAAAAPVEANGDQGAHAEAEPKQEPKPEDVKPTSDPASASASAPTSAPAAVEEGELPSAPAGTSTQEPQPIPQPQPLLHPGRSPPGRSPPRKRRTLSPVRSPSRDRRPPPSSSPSFERRRESHGREQHHPPRRESFFDIGRPHSSSGSGGRHERESYHGHHHGYPSSSHPAQQPVYSSREDYHRRESWELRENKRARYDHAK